MAVGVACCGLAAALVLWGGGVSWQLWTCLRSAHLGCASRARVVACVRACALVACVRARVVAWGWLAWSCPASGLPCSCWGLGCARGSRYICCTVLLLRCVPGLPRLRALVLAGWGAGCGCHSAWFPGRLCLRLWFSAACSLAGPSVCPLRVCMCACLRARTRGVVVVLAARPAPRRARPPFPSSASVWLCVLGVSACCAR